MISRELIEKFAYEFREALEEVVEKNLYGRLTIFEKFPEECCRYASDLFAEYIMQQGMPREYIQMIQGESFREGYTHCWLLICNCLVVDITADQFNGESYFKEYEPIPSCYVAPCDMKSIHDCFVNSKMERIYNVGIDSYSSDIPVKLKIVYDAVLEQINAKL